MIGQGGNQLLANTRKALTHWLKVYSQYKDVHNCPTSASYGNTKQTQNWLQQLGFLPIKMRTVAVRKLDVNSQKSQQIVEIDHRGTRAIHEELMPPPNGNAEESLTALKSDSHSQPSINPCCGCKSDGIASTTAKAELVKFAWTNKCRGVVICWQTINEVVPTNQKFVFSGAVPTLFMFCLSGWYLPHDICTSFAKICVS